MKVLVVLPTYNERQNIERILERVFSHPDLEALVVDDNSTDGTKEIIDIIAKREPRLNTLHRAGKLGLGTAYINGFKWGLERGYECFIEMDSDFSHNPDMLPVFASKIAEGADLAIGSRYIGGTISVVGWDFRRLLLSRFGNMYASRILDVPLTDLTSGFRAYSREALMNMDLDRVHSEGYSFQIEMAYYLWKGEYKVVEVPIIFTERVGGSSKMSKRIVREAVRLPWKLRWQSLSGSLWKTIKQKNRGGSKKT